MESFDRLILIDKPSGISSFGVVARVRRQLTEELNSQKGKEQPEQKPHFLPGVSRKTIGVSRKRVKVGHCGTLDPFATGLMILLSGKFTRRASELTKLDKVYEATIRLGVTSTTGDPEGEIAPLQETLQAPGLQEVEKVLKKFTGIIAQTPPIYSAIKIGGQRAYKLARKGQIPEIPPRQVEIYSIELLKYDYPILKIRTHVSSGTYIRTLAEDIGRELKTGAYTAALRRTKIGQYDVKNAELLSSY